MYIGCGWRVQGNKEAASDLDTFLQRCKSSDIESINPIQFGSGSGSFRLDLPKIYDREKLKLPREWVRYEDYVLKIVYKKRNNIVDCLKELDKKGIALPYFPLLTEIPKAVFDRVMNEVFKVVENKNRKLSEILQENPDLFRGDFSETRIPEYTTKAVSLNLPFQHEGPEFKYEGSYFFDRGTASILDIIICVDKKLKFKKGYEDKCPLKIEDIEQSIQNGIFVPRKINFVDNEGDGFRFGFLEQTSEISKTRGAIYAPEKNKDLVTLETLADWLIENNVTEEETKSKEKEETVKEPEESATSGGGGIA